MPTDPFAAMSADLFDGPLALDATYTPATGSPVSLRVIPDLSDVNASIGFADFHSTAGRFLLLVSDVADPAAGDVLTLDGNTYTVQGQPMRDARRNTWAIEARRDAD